MIDLSIKDKRDFSLFFYRILLSDIKRKKNLIRVVCRIKEGTPSTVKIQTH